jgi:hypothetical protein
MTTRLLWLCEIATALDSAALACNNKGCNGQLLLDLHPEVPMTNHDSRRAILADYLDQRVHISGVFERMTTNKNPHKPFKIALLQDTEVELSKAKHDLGHIWIQHAETLSEFQQGDRLRCSCRVGKYQKSLATPDANGFTVKMDYSLSYPSEAHLLSRPVAVRTTPERNGVAPVVPTPSEEEVHKPTDPVQLILEVKEVVAKVGGCEQIVALKDVIGKLGGWSRVLEVQTLADEVGGWDRLEQLLSLLKL